MPMTPRADVRRGLLTPETEDLAALTTAGADPTVMAFALLTPGPAAATWSCTRCLNRPEPVTYALPRGRPRPPGPVNQALDDAGFAATEIHAAASGELTASPRQDTATSPLAGALVAAVARDQAWPSRLTELLVPDRTMLA